LGLTVFLFAAFNELFKFIDIGAFICFLHLAVFKVFSTDLLDAFENSVIDSA